MDFMLPYRKKIDDLDDQIITLISRRFDVIRDVASAKRKRGVAAVLPDRVDQVRDRNVEHATRKNINPDLIYRIYSDIIRCSCELEEEMMAEMTRQETQKK